MPAHIVTQKDIEGFRASLLEEIKDILVKQRYHPGPMDQIQQCHGEIGDQPRDPSEPAHQWDHTLYKAWGDHVL